MKFLEEWFKSINKSFEIIVEGIKVLIKRPYLLLPIFLVWVLYASITIYFVYYFNWEQLSVQQAILLSFILIFVFCFIFSLSSFILLEFIEQIETGQKISLLKALYETFVKDIPRALPIMFIWAILWFIITILQILFSKRRRGSRGAPSSQNFAKTLGGYGKSSLGELTLDSIKSGMRLVVFFIYPAIAWEDESPLAAVEKGISTIQSNMKEFVSGFIQIEILIALIGIPVGIIFELSDNGVVISESVWWATIVYCGLVTSFYFYIQQMFAAILYMWNMRWIEAAKKAEAENNPIIDAKKPDLLDDIPDLLVK